MVVTSLGCVGRGARGYRLGFDWLVGDVVCRDADERNVVLTSLGCGMSDALGCQWCFGWVGW